MTFQYQISKDESGRSVLAVVDGHVYQANDKTHASVFEQILEGLTAEDANVADLFDLERGANRKFQRLTERVTVQGGKVRFDGDPLPEVLQKQVLRFIDDGVEDWKPLVAFYEHLASNPQEHSREQLLDWLNSHDFALVQGGEREGYIVGYKGVNEDYTSIHSGPAIVNDEEVDGHVPNDPGNVVEMARGEVEHNPRVACHTGLHVGTFSYAKDFSRGKVVVVHVNPRDVVSVPSDCSAQKMRACRYFVVGDAPEQAYSTPLVKASYSVDDADFDEDDECYDCGGPVDSDGECYVC